MSAASKSFIKGAAILAISGILCKLIGALYRIPLGNVIGTGGMGNYQIAYPVYSLLLVISSAGIPVAVSKMVAERLAKGDPAGAHYIFHVALRFLVVIGVGMSILLFVCADPLSRWLGLPSSRLCIQMVAPSIFFVAVVSAYRGYYQGMQMMAPTAISQVIEQLAKLAAGLALANLLMPYGEEYGAAGAILGVTVSELVGLISMMIYYAAKRQRLVPPKDMRGQTGFKQTLETMVRIALPVTVGACVSPLVGAIDSAVVMRVLTGIGYSQVEASSHFGLLSGFVNPLINMPAVFSASIAISLVPAITAARASGRRALVHYQTSFGVRLSILLGLPFSVGLYLFAGPILSMLYPNLGEQLPLAIELLRMMSIGVLFLSVVQVTTGILQGMGRTVIPVLNLLFGAAIKVFLGIALIAIPSINIKGAAIGTLACFGLTAVLNCSAIFGISGMKFSWPDYIFRPCIATGGMAVAAALAYHWSSRWGEGKALLTAVLAALLVYGILLLVIGAVREEDMRYLPGGDRAAGILRRLHIWR